MKYKILCEDKELDLINRLLKIRDISDDVDNFLNPKLKDYRWDPLKLNDMQKAVDRILMAIKNNEKIMIFGDYDVDWVTSSFILFKFLVKYVWYKNVSIMYPDRMKDWYWMKNKHLDDMKEKWIDLTITVDNGITSIWEAKYAKEIWIDMIITDHHKDLDELPDAIAVVNPMVSPDYDFKYIAWVGVAFKVICALLDQIKKFNWADTLEENWNIKNEIFNYFLPIVAIWTVADVVKLVWENRWIVKKWLELMNNHRDKIPESLKWFLEYLNIKEVDTFHIWFVIWPRINAWWRIDSPYSSLDMLLYTWEKQTKAIKKIDEINTNRKKLQESALKYAEENIDLTQKIVIAESEDFHEWIVWIVSGRLTEKYHKPSVVFKIDKEKWTAVASLRWPEYFDVIEMLQTNGDLLERFGWHKRAWWLTVKLENLDKFKSIIQTYCNDKISENNLEKTIYIDTKIRHNERNPVWIQKIQQLWPFGEWNSEPIFLFEWVELTKVDKVWKKWQWHLKLQWIFWESKINFLFWSKGDMVSSIKNNSKIDIVWKIKKDDFNGGYFVNGIEII